MFDAGGVKLSGSQSVVMLNLNDFEKNDGGKAALTGALGHEGTHVAEAQAEAARLKGATSGELFDHASSGGVMSRAITEVHAYRVSAYIAAAISPSDVRSSAFGAIASGIGGGELRTPSSFVKEAFEEFWSLRREVIIIGLLLYQSPWRHHC